MEVFIRDKNCATCPFSNKEKLNFICGDAIGNDIGLKTNYSICMLNYFANEENCPLKSLTQHDAELKAKWCDELMNWITDAENRVTECETWNMLQELRERQKLEEMKGEKDDKDKNN